MRSLGKNVLSIKDIQVRQGWDYKYKIQKSIAKILEYCQLNNNKVYVAFSGGADSTVLLDLVCRVWSTLLNNPEPLEVIYVNTTNEYECMPKHNRDTIAYFNEKYNLNLDYKVIFPKTNFYKVIKTIGYPVVSKKVSNMISSTRKLLAKYNVDYNTIADKLDDGVNSVEYLASLNIPQGIIRYLTWTTKDNHETMYWKIPKKWRKLLNAPFNCTDKCCYILKKDPMKQIKNGKGVFLGVMASDSRLRTVMYQKTGCINMNEKINSCMPMGFWLHQDKMRYLVENNLPVASIYGEIKYNYNGDYYFTGEQHTGCKLCLFGAHLEQKYIGENKIQRLKMLEPNIWKFAMKPLSEGGLGYKEVMDYLGLKYEPDIKLF